MVVLKVKINYKKMTKKVLIRRIIRQPCPSLEHFRVTYHERGDKDTMTIPIMTTFNNFNCNDNTCNSK